jgi:hypothetical protein
MGFVTLRAGFPAQETAISAERFAHMNPGARYRQNPDRGVAAPASFSPRGIQARRAAHD